MPRICPILAVSLALTAFACTERNPEYCAGDEECDEGLVCNLELHRCEESSGAPDASVVAVDAAGNEPDATSTPTPDAGPRVFTLTVVPAGTGSGSVTSSPSGIECGGVCAFVFEEGSEVTLLATPGDNSELAGWSGGGCSGAGVCNVTLDADVTVTATFDLLRFGLTVARSGAGAGGVTSSPAGIDCGADCSETYDIGTVVTLTATPVGAATFGGWSGDCAGLSSTCAVTMSAARSVGAAFDEGTVTLSVSFDSSGTGGGTITSNVGAIDCPGTCADSYTIGTSVTLTASPDGTSTFTGWSGACSGTGSCMVTMSAARSVVATFTRNTHGLTVSKLGTGTGTVTSTPPGINCGSDCSQTYDEGTVVTLLAAGTGISDFTGWGGACASAGTETTCEVTMSAARAVTASFTKRTHALTVSKAGTGTGTVTSVPSGISCGGDCNQTYDEGTVVTLTAVGTGISDFVGWGGACAAAGASSTCDVTMSSARSVSATFDEREHDVVVTIESVTGGGGDVTSSPSGIDCGVDCSQTYTEGTMVTLSATPDGDSEFLGWSGDCSGLDDCELTVDAAKDVTASFKRPAVIQIAAGGNDTCVVFDNGNLRCWGQNYGGKLGLGHVFAMGDDETPAIVPNVDVGGAVDRVSVGWRHVCVLMGDAIKCWGSNSSGQLGLGGPGRIGDDETPSSIGTVDIGGNVKSVMAGNEHTCVVLATNATRCFGRGNSGALGYGNTENIGDDEAASSGGDVPVTGVGDALATSSGAMHTCLKFGTGAVNCWGSNLYGQLGYGHTNNLGDDEPPWPSAVYLGSTVSQVATGMTHTCAVTSAGNVRCWGYNLNGKLGYGHVENIGDDELGGAGGDVSLGGGSVAQVVVGSGHTCALMTGGKVRCWGAGSSGALGYKSTENIGDDELPVVAGEVAVGGIVTQLAAGSSHTCALLDTGAVRCWGGNTYGQLGYGHTDDIGDDETPAAAGDVPLF